MSQKPAPAVNAAFDVERLDLRKLEAIDVLENGQIELKGIGKRHVAANGGVYSQDKKGKEFRIALLEADSAKMLERRAEVKALRKQQLQNAPAQKLSNTQTAAL